jgi:hypothetical protein
MDQVSIKYTIIFHCKTLQNLTKFGFLVWKQTILQPWHRVVTDSDRELTTIPPHTQKYVADLVVLHPKILLLRCRYVQYICTRESFFPTFFYFRYILETFSIQFFSARFRYIFSEYCRYNFFWIFSYKFEFGRFETGGFLLEKKAQCCLKSKVGRKS